MEHLIFFKNQQTPHLIMKKETITCNGWSTIIWNFPGFSRGFLKMFSKTMIIKYRSSACTHSYSMLRFTWNFVYFVGKRGCLLHDTRYAVSLPNNLIDPPPLYYGNQNATALQGQILIRRKSDSEHTYSGMGCNFRGFQGIFPGAKKIQGFSGLSSVTLL